MLRLPLYRPVVFKSQCAGPAHCRTELVNGLWSAVEWWTRNRKSLSPTSLSCINWCLAIDTGGNVSERARIEVELVPE